MQLENIDILSILAAVLIVILSIAVFYIKSTITKIDKIVEIDVSLRNLIRSVNAILNNIDIIISTNHSLDIRLSLVEKEVSNLKNEHDKARERLHSHANALQKIRENQ